MITARQFEALYPVVSEWIRRTLAASADEARAVASLGFPRLPHYFSPELLARSRAVLVDAVPIPPLTALGLTRYAAFEQGNYDGVTYLDTFFIRRPRAAEERIYFHELVHVVQWRVLGPERFLAAYAAGLETHGYRDCPLEAMAYEAETRFVESRAPFDAEAWVAMQLGERLPG